MTEQVNIHAAKTHFSRLVERAEAGEEIVIARDGRPVARLVPLPAGETTLPPPRPGSGGHAASREAAATYGSAAWADHSATDWLPAIVGRLVRLADPVRIVLFGSRAAGLARPDSDYDILVVLDRVQDRRARRVQLRAALADLPVAIDVVVAEPGELDQSRRAPRGIVQWASEAGRAVYVRA